RIPRRAAMACESPYSKPDGFLIVVPDALPFQKPGAGRSKPTMSFPCSLVGAALVCAEAVTTVGQRADTAAKRHIRLTTPPLILIQCRMSPRRRAPGAPYRGAERFPLDKLVVKVRESLRRVL